MLLVEFRALCRKPSDQRRLSADLRAVYDGGIATHGVSVHARSRCSSRITRSHDGNSTAGTSY